MQVVGQYVFFFNWEETDKPSIYKIKELFSQIIHDFFNLRQSNNILSKFRWHGSYRGIFNLILSSSFI